MKILSIDTSQKNTYLALDLDGNIISRSTLSFVPHSKTLMSSIEDLMMQGNITIKDLDAIAVVVGPGSFTGCRLSLSVAKGLSYPYHIPLIGVNSLELLNYNEGADFSVLKGIGKEIFVLENEEIYLDNLTEFKKKISCKSKIIVREGENLDITNKKEIEYSVEKLALFSREKFNNNIFTSIIELKPLYLRECQAEIEYKRKQNA